MFFVKQQNQNLHRSSISLYFPNLEEFRFITVVAFPKDSKIGFAMMILSWIRDPCAASVPQWWTNSNRQKYFEFCSRDAYIHREREIYIYIHTNAAICIHMRVLFLAWSISYPLDWLDLPLFWFPWLSLMKNWGLLDKPLAMFGSSSELPQETLGFWLALFSLGVSYIRIL